MNKVKPDYTSMINIDIALAWKKYKLEMLSEIEQFGRIKPKYKNNTSKRIWYTISTTLCGMICCGPCIIWDCMCCCTSMCLKSNPFKYGMGFECCTSSCNAIYEDERENIMKSIKASFIMNYPHIVGDVAKAYLYTFYKCRDTQTPASLKAANIIREQLVEIIRDCSPEYKFVSLKDTGNEEELHRIVNSDIYS